MSHKKEIEILENGNKLTLFIKQGFTQKASVLQEIRKALETFPNNKKINIYLAPQFEDTHAALYDIRRQLIVLAALSSSISSRSSVRFEQTYQAGTRKIHTPTYKLTSARGVCSVKMDSYKHPIEAYDDTAKEVAFVLGKEKPTTLEIFLRPACKEELPSFLNRAAELGRFFKQAAVEIPQLQNIFIWDKNGRQTRLAFQVKRIEGQLRVLPVTAPFAAPVKRKKQAPNVEIVSKYRSKQLKKAQELQNA